jgi:ribosomal protein L21
MDGNAVLFICSTIDESADSKVPQQAARSSTLRLKNMYAIIADGGRQYKVEEGQMLEIDFREVNVGDTVTFDRVLAVSGDSGMKLGKPKCRSAQSLARSDQCRTIVPIVQKHAQPS